MKIAGGLALQLGDPGLTDLLSDELAEKIAGAVYAAMLCDALDPKDHQKNAQCTATGRSKSGEKSPELVMIDNSMSPSGKLTNRWNHL